MTGVRQQQKKKTLNMYFEKKHSFDMLITKIRSFKSSITLFQVLQECHVARLSLTVCGKCRILRSVKTINKYHKHIKKRGIFTGLHWRS